MTARRYGWYLAAFAVLVASGAFIGIAAITLFESQTPMYVSISCSVAAIALAVVAWVRYPKGGGDRP